METDIELTVYAPATYQIRVQGVVGESRGDYYGGMTIDIDYDGGQRPVTTLTGQLQDQAALIGALTLLYSRCLPILSVEHLPDRQSREPGTPYQGKEGRRMKHAPYDELKNS